NDNKEQPTEEPPPPPPPPEQQPPIQQPPAQQPVQQPAQPPAQQPRPPATRRPATRVPTRVAVVPSATQRPIVAPQASPTSGAPVAGDTNVFFRIASDWGSAYPEQAVRYTLVLSNKRPVNADGSNDLRDVIITSSLPANLEVLGAQADRGGDPTVA